MNIIEIRNKLKERRMFMDENNIPEYNIPFDQLNVLLECIARFHSLSLGNTQFEMKLEMFNISKNELKEKYKEYQLKMYEDIIAQGYELYDMEDAKSFLNEKLELTETTINEFYRLIDDYIYYDRFSSWFYPDNVYEKTYTAFNLREEVIYHFNQLLLHDGYNFQVSKTQQESSNIENPQIYIIENEPPFLSHPRYAQENSYHLFICFNDKTYMFEFTH